MCKYCGKSSDDGAVLHVDHMIPLCNGGSNDPSNLKTACADCNHGKGPHPGPNGNGKEKAAKRWRPGHRPELPKELLGQFFHSRVEGKIHWQGCVLSELPGERYLVQLCSWLDGNPTERKIVPLDEMAAWSFYSSAYAMRWAYAQETRMSMRDFEFGEHCIEEMRREDPA